MLGTIKGRVLSGAPFYHLFLLQSAPQKASPEFFGVKLRKGREVMAGVKDYYRILGITSDAGEKEIKAAYRKLAKKYHPDTHPGDEVCETRFREINEAYSILGDTEKRKKYDEAAAGAETSGMPREQKGGRKSDSGQAVNFEEIHRSFESFFGFRPDTKEITNEEKLGQKNKNPLDTSELFERFMGIKR